MNKTNVSLFTVLAAAQPATASLVVRTFANSSTCALIGMVGNSVARELKAATQGASRQPGYLPEPGPTIDSFNEERDMAKDDNNSDHMIGTVPKLTLDQLVEFCAAMRATAKTIAQTFGDSNERRFAQPQEVKDSFEFLCTPRTAVTADQIEAVQEEEPEMSKEDVVKLLQAMAKTDADTLKANGPTVLAKVIDLVNQAPADRELDSIWADLPETYRNTMLDKAINKITDELARTLPLAIRGVPGISAKRKILKGDMPSFEELVAA
jgi:hypothetical protein